MESRRERRVCCPWYQTILCHGSLLIVASPDTEGSAAPVDPLAALEKTTDAQKNLTQVQIPRLESLQNVSEQYNSDPYTLSRKVRKRFREVKKVALEKEAADDSLKGRYGLPETLKLLDEAEDDAIRAKEEWEQARKELAEEASSKRRRLALTSVTRSTPSLPSSSSRASKTSGTDAVSALRARVLGNTARRQR